MNHRHLLFLLALILGTACLAQAQTPEDLFVKGNDAFQQGNFPQAIQAYSTIVQNGYASGELYYNLGNAYYKSGNIALAIVNYERAARLMPQDDDLRHNLQLANLMVTDKIEPTPRLFVWEWWDGIRNSFSIESATWWGYCWYVLLLVAFGVLMFGRTHRIRTAGLWGSGFSLVVFLFFLLVFLSRLSDVRRSDEAVVTASVANVKNSPDEKSSDAFVLHAGVKVMMTDRVETWVKIRIADGKVGWVEAGGLETI